MDQVAQSFYPVSVVAERFNLLAAIRRLIHYINAVLVSLEVIGVRYAADF